jgi:hypothetical protein
MANGLTLKHFKRDEILIKPDEAQKLLVFFFGKSVPSTDSLTDDDVAFAQALLLEAMFVAS